MAVYDDFLSEEHFGDLFRHVNAGEYRSVHIPSVSKVWRMHDGHPVVGPAAFYASPSVNVGPRYPTGTALDAFFQGVLRVLPDVGDIVGHQDSDWTAMSAAPFAYPAGTGLSLHRDGTKYTGAFTFYLHNSWNIHWGGQLLVFEENPALEATPPYSVFPQWLTDEEESLRMADPGLATCVFAKPNRLVFLTYHVLHMITRVDANAGSRPRVALSGFFHRKCLPEPVLTMRSG